jgi:hypothetical protein
MTKLVTVYLDGQYIKMHKDMLEAFTPGRMHAKGVFLRGTFSAFTDGNDILSAGINAS